MGLHKTIQAMTQEKMEWMRMIPHLLTAIPAREVGASGLETQSPEEPDLTQLAARQMGVINVKAHPTLHYNIRS